MNEDVYGSWNSLFFYDLINSTCDSALGLGKQDGCGNNGGPIAFLVARG